MPIDAALHGGRDVSGQREAHLVTTPHTNGHLYVAQELLNAVKYLLYDTLLMRTLTVPNQFIMLLNAF